MQFHWLHRGCALPRENSFQIPQICIPAYKDYGKWRNIIRLGNKQLDVGNVTQAEWQAFLGADQGRHRKIFWEKKLKTKQEKNSREKVQVSVGHIIAGTNLQTCFSSAVSLSCRMDPCWVLTATASMLGSPGFLLWETSTRTWSRHYTIQAQARC